MIYSLLGQFSQELNFKYPKISARLLKICKIPFILIENISKVIIFLLCTYVFSIPVLILSLFIYSKTEKYDFLIVFYILVILFFLFRQLFSAKIFLKKMKHILCFILVNILVWNISSFVIYRTFQLDGYMSENFDKLGEFDFIDAEYNKVDKKLTDFTAKELPYLKLKILHKSDNSTFTCYGFFGDSTRELNTKNINSILQNRTEYAIRTNNVRNKAKTNLEALKLSKDTLKYQRNKIGRAHV